MVRQICMHGKRPTKNYAIWSGKVTANFTLPFFRIFQELGIFFKSYFHKHNSVLLVIVEVIFNIRFPPPPPPASPKEISCTNLELHVH